MRPALHRGCWPCVCWWCSVTATQHITPGCGVFRCGSFLRARSPSCGACLFLGVLFPLLFVSTVVFPVVCVGGVWSASLFQQCIVYLVLQRWVIKSKPTHSFVILLTDERTGFFWLYAAYVAVQAYLSLHALLCFPSTCELVSGCGGLPATNPAQEYMVRAHDGDDGGDGGDGGDGDVGDVGDDGEREVKKNQHMLRRERSCMRKEMEKAVLHIARHTFSLYHSVSVCITLLSPPTFKRIQFRSFLVAHPAVHAFHLTFHLTFHSLRNYSRWAVGRNGALRRVLGCCPD